MHRNASRHCIKMPKLMKDKYLCSSNQVELVVAIPLGGKARDCRFPSGRPCARTSTHTLNKI